MSGELPPRALARLLADAEPLLAPPAALVHGKYRLVREVGRGAMGVVHEALDLELGRRVALKLLSTPAAASPAVRERFVREARAAARLTHPNVAAVYEASEDAIAMQFVDGVSLSLRPRDDRRALVRFVRDAALAVQAAHEQGIVHRDLKPQNLLVEGERVFVTDFGLAKDASVDAELSLSGHVLGTPAYMAPEQAQGRVRDIDPRTDVWGLGATLYDLLAGRPPFAHTDVVRTLRAVVEDEPAPMRALRPDVPRDLELVVRTCLAKEKERRYASARELADDLSRWLAGEPVLAEPPSLGYRAAKFLRRRRALVGLAAATATALAVALVAALSEQSQRRASALALALSEQVSGVLADAEMHRRLGEIEQASARLDQGIADARAFLARHDVAQAHALLGRLLAASGRSEEARAELDRALVLEPGLVEARLARGLALAAEVASAAARAEPPVAPGDPAHLSGELSARRALALADLEAVLGPDASGLRTIDARLAHAERARLLGQDADARADFEEVLRLDPLNVQAKIALSELALAAGNPDAAWTLAMSALDLNRGFGPAYLARAAAFGAAPADDALGRAVAQHELSAADERIQLGDASSEAYQLRGTARLRLADVDGALADFAAAVRSDPSDAMAHGNRGLVHTRRAALLAAAGDADGALTAWDDAIGDYRDALTIDPGLAGAQNNLGVARSERERLFLELGRADEAARERTLAGEAFDAALAAAPRFGLAYENRAAQRRRSAEAAARERDDARAAQALADSLSDLERALALHPGDPQALLERALTHALDARLHAARGEEALAAPRFAAARTDFDAAVGAASEDPRAVGLRGLFRLERGERDGARADLDRALALAPDARLRTALEVARAGM